MALMGHMGQFYPGYESGIHLWDAGLCQDTIHTHTLAHFGQYSKTNQHTGMFLGGGRKPTNPRGNLNGHGVSAQNEPVLF